MGRNTPISIGDSKPIDVKATLEEEKKGREIGAISYGIKERVSLLYIASSNPSSFNASEISSEWRAVHQEMCNSFYLPLGEHPRSYSTLHSHLVDMYGALKRGMRILSIAPGAPKCPTSYLEADDVELEMYVTSLFELLVSDKGKYQPKNSGVVLR